MALFFSLWVFYLAFLFHMFISLPMSKLWPKGMYLTYSDGKIKRVNKDLTDWEDK